MKTLLTLCALGLALFLAAGCRSFNPGPRFDPRASTATDLESLETVTNQLDAALLRTPTNLFTLGPGDVIEIEMLDDFTTRAITPVGPDGKIYFSLLPGVDVWGLTLTETRDLLEQEFGRYVRERPLIGVTLRETGSKHVWLLGRFQTPGVYPMPSPMTLLEAFSLAGGTAMPTDPNDPATLVSNTEDLADLKRAFIIRDGEWLPVDFERLLKHGDLLQNIYLQADDLIYLPAATAREIYIMGWVAAPSAVPYTEDLTLLSAVARARGTIRNAMKSEVAIVRGSLVEPQIALVNYDAIVKGREPDVRLEAGDIVYVPERPLRYVRRYADLVLRTFVSAVAINEGTRAIIRDSRPPEGIFIPLGSGITVTPPPPPVLP